MHGTPTGPNFEFTEMALQQFAYERAPSPKDPSLQYLRIPSTSDSSYGSFMFVNNRCYEYDQIVNTANAKITGYSDPNAAANQRYAV